MMRDALERKKEAVCLLAAAQHDLETHAAFMIEERDLDETIHFYDAHRNVGEHHTAVGRFMKAVSGITLHTGTVTRFESRSEPTGRASHSIVIPPSVLSMLSGLTGHRAN